MRRQVNSGGCRARCGWRTHVRAGGAAAALLLTLAHALLAVPASAQGCPNDAAIERVSIATNGDAGNALSLLPATSSDGCVVAFKSSASNLVSDDRNEKVDVFVRDRGAGTTERVSLSDIPGREANDNSFPPALNGSGRIVAFASLASNILRGDFNMGADVFVYNRDDGTTTNVTLVRDENGDGTLGGGAPDLPPSVSGNGRFVAFSASADFLVPNDNIGHSDVFVYDRDSATTSLISVATVGGQAGRPANADSAGAMISSDGCVVAFTSSATNLVGSDTNEACDVFVRDRCQEITERIAEQRKGVCQGLGFMPAVSADGRLVAFASDANLDGDDGNGVSDVYVRDRGSNTTTRISKGPGGETADGPSQFPSISGDGRFVVFQSAASNLGGDGANGKSQIFVADLSTGELRRVSATSGGEAGNNDSTAPQISADGAIVVFQSDASNLVPDDGNGVTDIFAAINPLGPLGLPTATPTPTGPSPTPTGPTATPTGPTRTPTGPTATPTGPTATPTGPTATPTGGTPTPTRTPTPTGRVPTVSTPTVPPTNTSRPTAGTPTVGSRTPTATIVHSSGGGGCSCRIDPDSGRVADASALPALGVPPLLWVVRRRRRRQQ